MNKQALKHYFLEIDIISRKEESSPVLILL